jgi:predicted esterase
MQYIIPSNINDPGKKGIFIFIILVVFVLFLKSHFTLAQQVSKVSPAGTKFWIYTPSGYPSSATTYPLLVVLHGGSEIGDDLTTLTSNTSHQIPSRLIYLHQWPQTLPFIVVSPLLKRDNSVPNPNDQEWPAKYVDEVVQYVRSLYKIDGSRMYFTGISLGGAGCWDYAFAYPSKVAALLPISGKTRPEKACIVKNIPIWAFHGESDALVSPQFSIDMVNAINACSPIGLYKPRLNLLYTRAHEGWNEIYNGTNGYKVYDWLLQFKKNSTVNRLPYVNAGFVRKILLRTKPLTLIGDYFDTDGSITSVKWTQTSGVALTMSGTTTKFLKLSNLKAGTFEFQLAITDNKGGVSSDKVSVTIVSSAVAPYVTTFTLMNGKTNSDVTNLTEGQVINKTTLGLTEINIRATSSSGTGSVRFSVNSDETTRIINSPGPYLITKQISAPEWQIKNGDYVICATPYPQTGARGVPGICQCYKITVTSSAPATVARTSADEVFIAREGDALKASRDSVQWLLNGEEIEGANADVITPKQNGEYFVRFTDDNKGTAISNSIVVTENKPARTSIKIYPNPSSSFVHVEGIDARTPAKFSIYNAAGIAVQQGILSDSKINLKSDLPRGIYTLKINTEANNETFRLVIE